VSGAGTVQTQGADVTVNINTNASFSADLLVNSGNTMLLDPGGPYTPSITGDITINNSAALQGGSGGYFIIAKGNVLNNGTIEGGSGSSFVMRGASLVNNGAITINNLRFDSTTALSGTGTYTSNAITINAAGNVSLSNNITFAPTSSFTINAVAERLNGILKEEFLLGENFKTKLQAYKSTKEAIETYNNLRPHMSIDYMTPDQKYAA